MSDVIEQQETRDIDRCGWNAKRFWVAVICCPVRNFDGEVLRRELVVTLRKHRIGTVMCNRAREDEVGMPGIMNDIGGIG